MNDYIFGYLENMRADNAESILTNIAMQYNCGLKQMPQSTLFGFPETYLPDPNISHFIFTITHSPESCEADYFIDYYDYSPDADFISPTEGKKRLDILINILHDMFIKTECERLVVSLTDSGYAYSTQKVRLSDLRQVLHADLAIDAPPDRLYDITQ